jgi:hypothetical protein
MKYLVFIAYYIYAITVLFGTAYVVFWKGQSGWWFLLSVALLGVAPSLKNGDKIDEI